MNKLIIFTITYNDSDNLLRTITSVRRNKTEYQKFYIVDGKSKDNTMNIITSNQDIIDDFICEKDSGIYNAMNKISKFEINDNDFILWLNSGDELLPITQDDFFKCNKYDCAFFSVLTKLKQSDSGRLVIPYIRNPYNEKSFFPKSFFIHQGFIIKKNVFESMMYNESIGLQAENLLMSQCIVNKSYSISLKPISIYYLDGLSSRKNWKILTSYFKVAKNLNFSIYQIFYYQFRFLFKTFIKIFIPYSIYNFLRSKPI